MINNIQVKNFKSLENINLDLKNLNLLTGLNSSGNSSLIQSILLIKQNIKDLPSKESIYNILEDETVKLRMVGDNYRDYKLEPERITALKEILEYYFK